jgi:MFS family permease
MIKWSSNNTQAAEAKKVKKSLIYSIIDGSFYNVMDGFTASFIVPFALFLKSSNTIISLLASIPDLLASFFQLSSIKASEVFKSRKLLIVFVVFIQSVLWLPLLLIPRFAANGSSGFFLLLFMTMIAMFGSFAGPLWRSMMGELVAEHERGSFFSKRNKIIAVVGFVSTFIAGFTLQHYAVTNPFQGFTILFIIAFIARSLSSLFIMLMYEKKSFSTQPYYIRKSSLTLRKFLRNLTKSDYGVFVILICIFRVCVAIATPFFAVYELKHLGFSYLQFTLLSAAEIAASFLFLGLWGRINDSQGSRMVLLITGFLLPWGALLYLFGSSFYYIIAVSFFSGAVWGGFNLAVGNFIFDASNSQERVRYVAYFNLLHGIAVFIGASTGALLLSILPAAAGSFKIIFLISGVLRFVIVFFFFPLMREMRIVQVSFDKRFFNYSLFIKPRQGFVEDPFDYYMAYEKSPRKPIMLKIDKHLVDDSSYKDPYEDKKKEHAMYKNFIQTLVDNMKKK